MTTKADSATALEITRVRFAIPMLRTEHCRVVENMPVVSYFAKELDDNRALGGGVAMIIVLVGCGVRNAGLLGATSTEHLSHHDLNVS